MPRRTLAAFDLKAARKMRGLSQAAAADILCATQPSIARWEAQGNLPEVFRKVWAMHWQLEAVKSKMAGGNTDLKKLKLEVSKRALHSSTRKTDMSDVPAGTKESTNDETTDGLTRRVKQRGRTPRSSKERTLRRTVELSTEKETSTDIVSTTDNSN
jgi:hypothetical protein